jgi:hypothetical protein
VNRPGPHKWRQADVPDCFGFFDRPVAFAGVHVLFQVASFLRAADEAFLREHRYRDVVFRPRRRKSAC